MSASHACPAMVITCMDWRLHPGLAHRLRARVEGPFDWVTVPGAARGLIADAGDSLRDVLLDALDTAVQLHGVGQVILVHHTDCGAYGGSATFPDAASEQAQHRADMASAASVIEARHPSVDVMCLLVRLEEGVQGWALHLDADADEQAP